MAEGTKLGAAYIPIRATLDELDKGLKQAKDKCEKATGDIARSVAGVKLDPKGFEEFGAKARSVGTKASIGLTAPLMLLGKVSADAASDLAESTNKMQVVFGKASASVEKFGASAAKNLGMSKQAAYEAAGTFGNLFVATGMAEGAAADMSTGVLQLSADLASFNNLSPEVTLEKLRAGLVGEAEPLRTLGVNLTADTAKAKAMEMGLADMNGELSAGALMQARYALILEQTTTAQGDFARTADGAANQARIMNAELADMQAEIGQKLLPTKMRLISTVRTLVGAFGALPPKMQTGVVAAGAMLAAVGPLATGIGLVSSGIGKLIPLAGKLGDVVGPAVAKLVSEKKALADLTTQSEAAADAKNKVTRANENLTKAADNAGKSLGKEGGILSRLSGAGSAGAGAVEGISRVIGSALAGGIAGAITSVGIGSIVSAIGSALAAAGAAIAAVVASPAFLIGAAIVAAVVAAIAVWRNWESIGDFFGEWTGKAKEWLGPFIAAVGNFLGEQGAKVGAMLGSWGEAIGDFFGGLPANIGSALRGFVDAVSYWTGFAFQTIIIFGQRAINWLTAEIPTWPGKVAGFLGNLADVAGQAFGAAKDAIVAQMSAAWSWITSEIPTWPGRLAEWFNEIRANIQAVLANARQNIINALTAAWAWISSEIPTWPGRFLSFVAKLPTDLLGLFERLRLNVTLKLGELWGWISLEIPTWPARFASFLWGIIDRAGNIFNEMKDAAIEGLRNLWQQAGAWAENIKNAILGPLRGLIDGIRNIWDRVRGEFERGREEAEETWGVGSPAKVAIGIGESIREGFTIGLKMPAFGNTFPNAIAPPSLATFAAAGQSEPAMSVSNVGPTRSITVNGSLVQLHVNGASTNAQEIAQEAARAVWQILTNDRDIVLSGGVA